MGIGMEHTHASKKDAEAEDQKAFLRTANIFLQEQSIRIKVNEEWVDSYIALGSESAKLKLVASKKNKRCASI